MHEAVQWHGRRRFNGLSFVVTTVVCWSLDRVGGTKGELRKRGSRDFQRLITQCMEQASPELILMETFHMKELDSARKKAYVNLVEV